MTRAAFKTLLEEILSVPAGTLQESDTRETLGEWSSLVDVQIMSLVSSEFGIDVDVDLVASESIGELLDMLDNKGAFSPY